MPDPYKKFGKQELSLTSPRNSRFLFSTLRNAKRSLQKPLRSISVPLARNIPDGSDHQYNHQTPELVETLFSSLNFNNGKLTTQ